MVVQNQKSAKIRELFLEIVKKLLTKIINNVRLSSSKRREGKVMSYIDSKNFFILFERSSSSSYCEGVLFDLLDL